MDLKDHLAGGLNQHRLPSFLWREEWLRPAGCYVNRVFADEYLDFATSAGFKVVDVEVVSRRSPGVWEDVADGQHLRDRRDDLSGVRFTLTKVGGSSGRAKPLNTE